MDLEAHEFDSGNEWIVNDADAFVAPAIADSFNFGLVAVFYGELGGVGFGGGVEVAEGIVVGDEEEEEGVGGSFGVFAFDWGAGDEVFTGGFGAKKVVGGVEHGVFFGMFLWIAFTCCSCVLLLRIAFRVRGKRQGGKI